MGPFSRAQGAGRPAPRSGAPGGAISARAGSSTGPSNPAGPGRGRPRANGEQCARVRRDQVGAGPSPQARGAVHRGPGRRSGARPIPARAGSRAGSLGGVRRARVRPRGRREQTSRRTSAQPGTGLPAAQAAGMIPWWKCLGTLRASHNFGPPPRGRGAVDRRRSRRRRRGSIPANARTHRHRVAVAVVVGIIPRAYGEQGDSMKSAFTAMDPSPPARRADQVAGLGAGRGGSIPARTGSRGRFRASAGPCWVHPRAYGEQPVDVTGVNRAWGPSPCVRGAVCRRSCISPS